MGIFGWSYPPGAANDPLAPYNQTDEPIGLAEDKTLKGCGRRGHGLNGKDADLSAGGQNVVESAFWFEDHMEINGYRYAALVPSEDWNEDQKNLAQEIICDCGHAAEWDGDYWTVRESYNLNVPCTWNDKQTDKKNIKRAVDIAYRAIMKNSRVFERDMTHIAEQFDNI